MEIALWQAGEKGLELPTRLARLADRVNERLGPWRVGPSFDLIEITFVPQAKKGLPRVRIERAKRAVQIRVAGVPGPKQELRAVLDAIALLRKHFHDRSSLDVEVVLAVIEEGDKKQLAHAKDDDSRVDDAVLALLHLVAKTEKGKLRASKSLDEKILSRLHTKGFISAPRGSSVTFTAKGATRAKEVSSKLFGGT